MGSLKQGDGVKIAVKNDEEVKRSKNVGEFEEIPLDVKDYEELGLIIELGEDDFNLEKASVNFDAMFSDFFPEEEREMNYEKAEFIFSEEPTSEQFRELEKWMEIPPPEEKFVAGPLFSGANNNWDHEIMEWLWSPYSYEEYLRFYYQR